MKLVRILKVSETEFYDHLEKEFIENFFQCTQKRITTEDIKKGLSYVQISKKVPGGTTLTLTDYKRGHYYGVEVKNAADTYTLFYQTKVVEKGLEISFEQTVASFKKESHSKLMGWFSEGVYLGRMSDILFDIQKKIHLRREEA